ncbi:MAG: molybdopterin molybdotransferase MoeA, partial [Limisphaerales bacterium]
MKPGTPQAPKMLSFEQALSEVEARLASAGMNTETEVVSLGEACGRVLAEDLLADRHYPPFNRSTRDGFAVRSMDVAHADAELTLDGEVRAGEYFKAEISPGHCAAIMTGAPLPVGTDAVVMVEHAQVKGDKVRTEKPVASFENVVRKGSEAQAGQRILPRGMCLRAGEIGLLASIGKEKLAVYVRPRIAILPTGDEVVP